jgi:multidrug resistance efflux pump
MNTVPRLLRPTLAVAAVAVAIWQVALLMALLRGGMASDSVETASVKKGPFIVGISRDGAVESGDVVSVRAPRAGRHQTLTWLIEDGSEVEEGDVIAKVDMSQYHFEVDQQRLGYENRAAQVEQEQRDRTRDHESAQFDVERHLRGLEVLTRSQFTEKGQSDAQVGFDRWNLQWSETDYGKQSRLFDGGIVPESQVDHSERVLRSREHALDKSQKDGSYLGAEHASGRTQAQSDIDTSQFEAELAERRIGEAVDSARKRAARAAEQLKEAEEQLAAGDVKAPKPGIVVLGKTWGEMGRRTLREGDRLRWHSKVADIADLSDLRVELRVDEASIHKVRVGQEVVIGPKGASEPKSDGEVISIGAVAREVRAFEEPNAVPGQRSFDVLVKIHDPDLDVMRPGMAAEAQFVSERLADVLSVPVEAVFDHEGKQIAYVQRGDRFVARAVTTGERNDEAVVILSGLTEHDRVALTDPTRQEAR